MQFSDKDEHIYFWFPLLAGLSELTFDPRSELRHSALGVRPTPLVLQSVAYMCTHSLPPIPVLCAYVTLLHMLLAGPSTARLSRLLLIQQTGSGPLMGGLTCSDEVQVLFDTLKYHGGAFTTPFWTRIFDSVLLPIFDHVRAEVRRHYSLSRACRACCQSFKRRQS